MTEDNGLITTLDEQIVLPNEDGSKTVIDIVKVQRNEPFREFIKRDMKENPIWKCIIGMTIFCILELLLMPGGWIVPDGIKLPKLLANLGWAICAISWCVIELKNICKSL